MATATARRSRTRGEVTASLLNELPYDASSEKPEHEALIGLLDAMDKEYGPPSAENEAWARRVLRL